MNNKKYEYFGDDPKFKTKLITFTLLIGGFFGFLNETLLNVALTKIMGEFHVEKTTVQWMATGFMLIMGAFTPISASVVQWFSTKKMIMITQTIFLLGTFVCSIAPTFSILLTGRLLQAISTAFFMPIIFNTILLIYSPEKRGSVMGLIGMIFMVAPAIGPTLSGIIVQNFSWRYLFIFTMPFTIFSMILVLTYLKVNMQEITKPKIDILSSILSIVGLGGLVYVASSYSQFDNKYLLFSLLVISIVAITLFVIRQNKIDTPLIDLSIFKIKQFTLGIILFIFVDMIFISSELIMPMYMQQVVLLSSVTVGFVLFPGSVANGLMSPIAGKLLDKYGASFIIFPGTILLFISIGLMYFSFGVNTSAYLIATAFTLLSLAAAMIFMPAETNSLNALPKEQYPHGTAVITTLQPVAGAIGTALFVTLLSFKERLYLNDYSTQTTDIIRQATLSGVSFVYFIMMILAVISILIALKIKKYQKNKQS